jgi:flagellar hook assembly protein FlgD
MIIRLCSVTGSTLGPDNTVTGVEGKKNQGSPGLTSPVPNPASNSSSIGFYIPAKSVVQLGVYDVQGRKVRSLIDGEMPAGLRSVSWNGLTERGSVAAGGVYFYRLRVNGKSVGERKFVLVW